jgi:hypothetical protein
MQRSVEDIAALLCAYDSSICARAHTRTCLGSRQGSYTLSLVYMLDDFSLVRCDFIEHPSYSIPTPYIQVFRCNQSASPRLLSFSGARRVFTQAPNSSFEEFVEEMHPDLLVPSLSLHVCKIPTTTSTLPACLSLYFPKLRLPPISAALFHAMQSCTQPLSS